jgi:hypothetical protein
MSKKYVPSFIKDQQGFIKDQQTESQETKPSGAYNWRGKKEDVPPTKNNQFSVLSDDFPIKKVETPVKMATLASLTNTNVMNTNGTNTNTNSSNKSSYAAKFSRGDTPVTKHVNIASQDEFPSLGSNTTIGSNTTVGSNTKVNEVVVPSNTFAKLASGWATKQKEDEEDLKRKKLEEEKKTREAELIRTITISGLRRRNVTDEDETDECEQSSLGGHSDEYELPDDDMETTTDEENESEFNQNIMWDGRRKDDLY